MTPQDLCVSLPTARAMQEAGWTRHALCHHVKIRGGGQRVWAGSMAEQAVLDGYLAEALPAPVRDEIEQDLVERGVDFDPNPPDDGHGYLYVLNPYEYDATTHEFEHERPAEAAAALWLTVCAARTPQPQP